MSRAGKKLMKLLRSHPNHMMIQADGRVLYALAPNDRLIAVTPPPGKNFSSMSEEEIHLHFELMLEHLIEGMK